jgi:hypothetical protein
MRMVLELDVEMGKSLAKHPQFITEHVSGRVCVCVCVMWLMVM